LFTAKSRKKKLAENFFNNMKGEEVKEDYLNFLTIVEIGSILRVHPPSAIRKIMAAQSTHPFLLYVGQLECLPVSASRKQE
jgi:hypothetical protein